VAAVTVTSSLPLHYILAATARKRYTKPLSDIQYYTYTNTLSEAEAVVETSKEGVVVVFNWLGRCGLDRDGILRH